jgi:hypothetical protein
MHRIAVLFLAVLLAGCLGGGRAPEPTPEPEPPYAFGSPVRPTPAPDGYGSEPGILATRDGTLFVVSILGSATARGDAVWKSTDEGASWTYLGMPDYPFGGGDADLAEDDAGTIYLTGQWRPAAVPGAYIAGGESVAVSRDRGASWTVHPSASGLPVTDRQWLATQGTGTVYLAFNQAQRGLTLTKSVDSGATWGPPRVIEGTWTAGDGVLVQGGPTGIPGDLLIDAAGRLHIPYAPRLGSTGGVHRLFVSSDGGVTFNARQVHQSLPGERPSAIFGSLAQDDAGHYYYVWAETYGGQKGVRVLLRASADGVQWRPPVQVSAPGMAAVFPWVVAGARVAVAYYAARGEFVSDAAPAGAAWFPIVSFGQNAHNNHATFEAVVVTDASHHRGPICTVGTGCTTGRELGDFFETALLPDGRVAIVWAETTGDARANVVAVQSRGSLR